MICSFDYILGGPTSPPSPPGYRWSKTPRPGRVNKKLNCTDYAESGIQFLVFSKLTTNWKNDNYITICRHDVIVKFIRCCLVFLGHLVTGSSFIRMSSLVLRLWQFSLIRIDQKSGNRKYPRLSYPQYECLQ